jgi:hypothetical protein
MIMNYNSMKIATSGNSPLNDPSADAPPAGAVVWAKAGVENMISPVGRRRVSNRSRKVAGN